jgi:hypothetical protein
LDLRGGSGDQKQRWAEGRVGHQSSYKLESASGVAGIMSGHGEQP